MTMGLTVRHGGETYSVTIGDAARSDTVVARRQSGGVPLRGRMSDVRRNAASISWQMPHAVPARLDEAICEAIGRRYDAEESRRARVWMVGRVVTLRTDTSGATWYVEFGSSVHRRADEGGEHAHRHLALAELRDVVLREQVAGRALRVEGAAMSEVQS